MTTPSFDQILAREPAFAGIIDGMTELLPGVPANEKNVKLLLDAITNHTENTITQISDSAGYCICLRAFISKKKCRISATLKGPEEVWTFMSPSRHRLARHTRAVLLQKTYSSTTVGLLDMLHEIKTTLIRYRLDGPCPKCRRDTNIDSEAPPVKRVKLLGFPYCVECSLKEICGFSETAE